MTPGHVGTGMELNPMFKERSGFLQPANEQIKIWRYMDFTKLVSLLDSGSLFFTRADKFDDAFEGSWPKQDVKARMDPAEHMEGDSRKFYLQLTEMVPKIIQSLRPATFINCWHMNEHESAAMWRLYLKSDEGIAVQSTYKRLRSSIVDARPVCLGVVQYIDYERESLADSTKPETAFVHKRKSFEHERELRAIVLGMSWKKGSLEQQGLKIKVSVEGLIEKIHVAPNSPPWVLNLVKSVVRRFGYELDVVQSKLDEQPVF